MISSKIVKIKSEKPNNSKTTEFHTINGVKRPNGIINIKIKIFDIEKNVDVYVIDDKNFKYNFLVGLDIVKQFKLRQDENLNISQKTNTETNRSTNKKIQNDMENHSINFNEFIDHENFKLNIDHLDTNKKNEIYKIIETYKTIFAKDKYDVGKVTKYEAHIDLLVDKHCNKRPYKCSTLDRKEIENQISKLLEKQLIEESYSPFAAPVTLAYKREENKRSRLCIDFRDLNKIIVPEPQPFPLIQDLIIKARNCEYFTTLDINSAFWSIPLRIEDRKKTGFVTQEGHFQWTCLPFGLKTSPAIFQRILSGILRKYKLTDFAVNYIDDILIFSESFTEHISHISKVLNAIIIEGFRLKLTKCTFAESSVKYLGHIIGHNTVRPLKDNLKSIREFPIPKTQKNIRQFLGKVNFYHEYIPKISIILEPLHNLLRKNEPFIWSIECQTSFDKIKELLCSQPILEIFDHNLPIKIYTDASLEGLGAILKQIQLNGTEKVVAYFSKKINETQKKKKAIFLECLAIKEAISFWQFWLIGKTFTVYTDHKPLENLNVKVRTDEELGDLIYYITQFDVIIKYAPGKNNLEADCLSRNPVLESNINNDTVLKIVNLINLREIQNDQRENSDINYKTQNVVSKNNIYYKKQKNNEKIILSEKFCQKFIKKVHESMGHIGIRQLQMKICPIYTAKNMIKNIQQICKNCQTCKKNKSRGQEKIGLMSHLGPATKPFEIVSIDTVGGFGGSRSTKRYLHLLEDHFTRYAYILTSKNQNANDFIKLLKNIPEIDKINMILTDQYPGINSKEFKRFVSEKGISLVFTAVNSPFSNGLNERLNQTLVNKIRCVMNEKKKKISWTTVAHDCVKQYNNSEHTVTGFAPKYLLYGTDVSLLPNELKKPKDNNNWNEDKKLALSNTIKSHNYNKKLFDKQRRNHEFKVGDRVYIENGNKLNRKKLDELRIGPYSIVEKLSNSLYIINTGHKKPESNIFHVTKILPSTNANDIHCF